MTSHEKGEGMPSEVAWAVISSGAVGLAGVVVPAITTWLTKRGDRAHDLALKRHEQTEARRARLLDERERLYLDFLPLIRAMWAIINAVHDGRTPSPVILEEASGPEAHPQLLARVDAFASDAARELLSEWVAVTDAAFGEVERSDPDWPLRATDIQDRLTAQLRRELQGEA